MQIHLQEWQPDLDQSEVDNPMLLDLSHSPESQLTEAFPWM